MSRLSRKSTSWMRTCIRNFLGVRRPSQTGNASKSLSSSSKWRVAASMSQTNQASIRLRKRKLKHATNGSRGSWSFHLRATSFCGIFWWPCVTCLPSSWTRSSRDSTCSYCLFQKLTSFNQFFPVSWSSTSFSSFSSLFAILRPMNKTKRRRRKMIFQKIDKKRIRIKESKVSRLRTRRLQKNRKSLTRSEWRERKRKKKKISARERLSFRMLSGMTLCTKKGSVTSAKSTAVKYLLAISYSIV